MFQDPDNREETRTLDLQLLRQNIGKAEEPEIDPINFRSLMDLDTITARAIQKKKNGLSKELRKVNITDTGDPDHYLTQIPEYFDLFDARKPPEVWVNDRLRDILQECFDYRAKLEKDMSRHELLAFD